MPPTLATSVEDAVYRLTMPLLDFQNEKIRKQFRVANVDDMLQTALRHFDNLTQAKADDPTASIDAGLTGFKTTAGSGTVESRIANFITLTFSKAHPLNANKTVYAYFTILAPATAIVNETTKALIIDTETGEIGTTTTTAATNLPEQLGALVNWLEDALIYTAVNDTDYVGGWDFQPTLTTIGTLPKVVDQSQVS